MAPTAKPKVFTGKGNVTPPNEHAAAAPGRVRRTQTPARTGVTPAKKAEVPVKAGPPSVKKRTRGAAKPTPKPRGSRS